MNDTFDLDVLLSQAVEQLADLADAADEGDIVEVAQRLDLGEQLALVARQIVDVCTESLIDRMESPSVVIAGVGMLTRTASKSSVWKGKDASKRFRHDVLQSISTQARVNPDTGEITPASKLASERAMSYVDEFLPAFQTLKADGEDVLGVSVRDYKEVQYRSTIKLDRGVTAMSATGEVVES